MSSVLLNLIINILQQVDRFYHKFEKDLNRMKQKETEDFFFFRLPGRTVDRLLDRPLQAKRAWPSSDLKSTTKPSVPLGLVQLATDIVRSRGWPGDDEKLTLSFQQKLRHSANDDKKKELKRKAEAGLDEASKKGKEIKKGSQAKSKRKDCDLQDENGSVEPKAQTEDIEVEAEESVEEISSEENNNEDDSDEEDLNISSVDRWIIQDRAEKEGEGAAEQEMEAAKKRAKIRDNLEWLKNMGKRNTNKIASIRKGAESKLAKAQSAANKERKQHETELAKMKSNTEKERRKSQKLQKQVS